MGVRGLTVLELLGPKYVGRQTVARWDSQGRLSSTIGMASGKMKERPKDTGISLRGWFYFKKEWKDRITEISALLTQ